MTEQDMGKILAVIRANLPGVFLQQTEQDARFMANQWAKLFADKSASLVEAAAETYCYRTTDRKNFPTPGNIREIVEELEKTVEHMALGYWVELPKDKPLPPSVSERVYKAIDAKSINLYGATKKQRIEALIANTAMGLARLEDGK